MKWPLLTKLFVLIRHLLHCLRNFFLQDENTVIFGARCFEHVHLLFLLNNFLGSSVQAYNLLMFYPLIGLATVFMTLLPRVD